MTTSNTTAFSVAGLEQKITQQLNHTYANSAQQDKKKAIKKAVCLAVNEVIFEKLAKTNCYHQQQKSRSVNYLSLEYLMGRLLSNNLHNLDLFNLAEQAVDNLGYQLADILEEGEDLALGNGGLGRLAACFLDSLATMDFHGYGYGIHYQHGLFKQSFKDCRQVEAPDEWREYGNTWEVCRPEARQKIALYGEVKTITSADNKQKQVWQPKQTIIGVPWDIPVVGYRSKTVNILRLWQARADSFFDWQQFNQGDFHQAFAQQNQVQTISTCLYPNDETEQGKELRFIQQYFFCACSIKDIINRYQAMHGEDWSFFADKMVIQLNDTHPAIAILELLRILIDDYDFDFKQAFALCRQCFAYTNHTLLPEALEQWSLALFKKVLPRHLTILYQVNEFVLNEEVAKQWPNDDEKRTKLSLIADQQQMVRMAHLCVTAAFKVNGVAQLHSDLVKSDLFPEFDRLYPNKFINITNGVTPRRWLKQCNQPLSALIDSKLSVDWAKDLSQLKQLQQFADDENFQQQFMTIKHENKRKLAEEIKKTTGVTVDANAIFDVQIKRLHEYKRQHLNLLHILALYRRLLNDADYDMQPRVYIFGAKAAPSYYLAKEIIYAINCVAEKVNNDARIKGKLKVVFMPNYRVTLAEKIIPAADVSEQISTAGKEASGTGNMKLALNGAVTLGTLDGANVEIAQEVGDENIFIFGNTVDEIKALKAGGYNPEAFYHGNDELKVILDWLKTDYFTPGKPAALNAIYNSLMEDGDPYCVLADFEDYCQANIALDKAYSDKKAWARMAIINMANMGKFTSDRSIQDYVDNIWQLTPVASK